jgi:hypothetical protein
VGILLGRLAEKSGGLNRRIEQRGGCHIFRKQHGRRRHKAAPGQSTPQDIAGPRQTRRGDFGNLRPIPLENPQVANLFLLAT